MVVVSIAVQGIFQCTPDDLGLALQIGDRVAQVAGLEGDYVQRLPEDWLAGNAPRWVTKGHGRDVCLWSCQGNRHARFDGTAGLAL